MYNNNNDNIIVKLGVIIIKSNTEHCHLIKTNKTQP